MINKNITETQIGGTLYIVKAECSPKATETIEQKLERIISRHIAGVIPDTKSYRNNSEEPLDICETVCEHRLTI